MKKIFICFFIFMFIVKLGAQEKLYSINNIFSASLFYDKYREYSSNFNSENGTLFGYEILIKLNKSFIFSGGINFNSNNILYSGSILDFKNKKISSEKVNGFTLGYKMALNGGYNYTINKFDFQFITGLEREHLIWVGVKEDKVVVPLRQIALAYIPIKIGAFWNFKHISLGVMGSYNYAFDRISTIFLAYKAGFREKDEIISSYNPKIYGYSASFIMRVNTSYYPVFRLITTYKNWSIVDGKTFNHNNTDLGKSIEIRQGKANFHQIVLTFGIEL